MDGSAGSSSRLDQTIERWHSFVSDYWAHDAEAFYDSTSGPRDATSEQQVEYIRRIAEAGRVLIQTHEIDPKLFDSPARSTLFLAIADGFTANDLMFREERSPNERREYTFLTRRTMTLAADHSEAQRRADAQHDLTMPEVVAARTAGVFHNCMRFVDTDLSDEIQQRMEETGPDSLLGRARQHLASEDRPFRVVVLDIASSHYVPGLHQPALPDMPEEGETVDQAAIAAAILRYLELATDPEVQAREARLQAQREANRQELETALNGPLPHAWIAADPTDGVPTMFVTEQAARLVLGHGAVPGGGLQDIENQSAAHEFFHTQRTYRVANRAFGAAIDEVAATAIAGEDSAYETTNSLFDFAGAVAGFDLRGAILDAAAYDNPPDHLFPVAAEELGLAQFLRLATGAPIENAPQPEIPSLEDGEHPYTRFVELQIDRQQQLEPANVVAARVRSYIRGLESAGRDPLFPLPERFGTSVIEPPDDPELAGGVMTPTKPEPPIGGAPETRQRPSLGDARQQADDVRRDALIPGDGLPLPDELETDTSFRLAESTSSKRLPSNDKGSLPLPDDVMNGWPTKSESPGLGGLGIAD